MRQTAWSSRQSPCRENHSNTEAQDTLSIRSVPDRVIRRVDCVAAWNQRRLLPSEIQHRTAEESEQSCRAHVSAGFFDRDRKHRHDSCNGPPDRVTCANRASKEGGRRSRVYWTTA